MRKREKENLIREIKQSILEDLRESYNNPLPLLLGGQWTTAFKIDPHLHRERLCNKALDELVAEGRIIKGERLTIMRQVIRTEDDTETELQVDETESITYYRYIVPDRSQIGMQEDYDK